MKFINKNTKEIIVADTYTKLYMCTNNSDFEIVKEEVKETKKKKVTKDED